VVAVGDFRLVAAGVDFRLVVVDAVVVEVMDFHHVEEAAVVEEVVVVVVQEAVVAEEVVAAAEAEWEVARKLL